MWAVQYRSSGGPKVLRLEKAPRPVLRPGQVLVRTLASGVSRVDVLYRRGRLPHGVSFPKRTGFDAVGQVVAGSSGPIKVGDWVAVVLGLEPLRGRGTTVELLAVEPSRCGRFPAGYVPSVEDCALVLGGLTALRAVRNGLRVRRGDRLLVVGAGGPVGMAAIQIARGCGASVDAIAGRTALERCRGLGAEHVRDYRSPEAEAMRGSRSYDGVVVAAGSPAAWFGAACRGATAAPGSRRCPPRCAPGCTACPSPRVTTATTSPGWRAGSRPESSYPSSGGATERPRSGARTPSSARAGRAAPGSSITGMRRRSERRAGVRGRGPECRAGCGQTTSGARRNPSMTHMTIETVPGRTKGWAKTFPPTRVEPVSSISMAATVVG